MPSDIFPVDGAYAMSNCASIKSLFYGSGGAEFDHNVNGAAFAAPINNVNSVTVNE